METTRRFWIDAALVGALGALGVLTSRPILFVGAAALGAWLLTEQHRFARHLVDGAERLAVTQSVPDAVVYTNREVDVTIEATLDRPSTVEIGVEPGLPVGTVVDGGKPTTIAIRRGGHAARRTLAVRWPVAGPVRFDPATVEISDGSGRFVERFEAGATPEFDVEPGVARNIHVGKRTERLERHGEYLTPDVGSGFEPEELREYTTADPVSRIDWKATARLPETYVREFEIETDRRLALLVDGRHSMGDGPPGETKLDYARHVALTLVDRAREQNDPIGYYAVDDHGVTGRLPPGLGRGHSSRVRNALHALTPSADPGRRTASVVPGEAQRKAARLDDGSAFGSRLNPYFGDTMSYYSRIERDPLYATVGTYFRRIEGPLWTVLFTDDTRPTEVHEAVTLARRTGSRVLVFLTPTVLFERDGLDDLHDAHARYVEFERFRRSLDGMDRVSAFEVAPEDRLRAVLSAGSRLTTRIRP